MAYRYSGSRIFFWTFAVRTATNAETCIIWKYLGFVVNTSFGMGTHESIPHLAFLGQTRARMANFLTFDLYVGINVAICLIVMRNYVYFCLTEQSKGGDERQSKTFQDVAGTTMQFEKR